MKVIDLLNKIANGEEVPKRIKWGVNILIYDDEVNDYRFDDRTEIYTDKFINIWSGSETTKCFLNDEVEITQEEQNIEKAKILLFEETGEAITYPKSEEYNEQNFKEIKRVTDELIKAVNELKNKED